MNIIAMLLLATATPSFSYEADTVDINQGVYICDNADKATVDKLATLMDDETRRNYADVELHCPFNIGEISDVYQAEEYPVQEVIAEVCYKGGKDYCEEQAFAVKVYMGNQPKIIIGLWLDEDRD